VTDWRWVLPSVAYALHDEQLAEHGGLEGIRDQGGVQAALDRPRNLAVYGDPDAADLAAAYCYGLATTQHFNDGNKRTAHVVARLFLMLNGRNITFDFIEAYEVFVAVAKGERTQEELAIWYRSKLVPI
jgi:death-on-curing protein